jgi:UDP-GlcNAc:undecaprenyl-phosphate GlcNAc-1-phosphate transferase
MTSALAAILAWPFATFVGSQLNIIDYPDERKVHHYPTLRTGGILIFLGFMFGLLISKPHFYSDYLLMTLCSISIFTLGLFEDKYRMGAKLRLLIQGSISYACIIGAGYVLSDLGLLALPQFLQVPFTVFAIVGVINAFNMIDGMNGLSSGLGVIAAASLGIIAHQHGDHEVFGFALVFAGALAGFMAFNLRGKIFMGDSGSYLSGFMISVLAVMLVNRNPSVSPFAPFLIISIPIFDALFAIYRRTRKRLSPFKADKRHLHHILERRYHSQRKAVLVILAMQAAMAILAIALHSHTLVLAALAVLGAVLFRRLWLRRVGVGEVSI